MGNFERFRWILPINDAMFQNLVFFFQLWYLLKCIIRFISNRYILFLSPLKYTTLLSIKSSISEIQSMLFRFIQNKIFSFLNMPGLIQNRRFFIAIIRCPCVILKDKQPYFNVKLYSSSRWINCSDGGSMTKQLSGLCRGKNVVMPFFQKMSAENKTF